MEERQKKKRQILICAVLFAASLAFYLAWYMLDGIIITEDAPSYINMGSDREPGYCLYLMMLRKLFGAEAYLHAAVVGQCIVAAAAACAITLSLTSMFSLNLLGSAGVLAVQYGITLLNRFAAKRGYSYFNSIETEGLAYSLWVFYFLCIIGIWYNVDRHYTAPERSGVRIRAERAMSQRWHKKDRKSAAGAVFWAMLLISIRKQMMITLAILFIVMICSYIKGEGWKKAAINAIITCMLCLAGTWLFDCGYNLAVRGEFAPHTGDSSFILGTELYLADKEMAENIKDARNRDVFLEIMKRADERGYNTAYAGKGWQAVEDHYSSAYDRIKFDIVMPVIRESQDVLGIGEADREADYNLIAQTLMKELLMPTAPRLAKLFMCNVLHGLITTILKVHPLLNWCALVLYLLYAVAIFWLYALGRGNRYEGFNNPAHFAWIVLLAIAANVCFTSLTIYCQMRYMLYNTGLFYQALGVMILHILACAGQKQGRHERGRGQMKIVFHLNCLERGGAERVVTTLSGQFAAHGYEVYIATQWQGEDEYETDARVKRVHVGLDGRQEKHSRIIKFADRILNLRRFLKETDPDIVIAFARKANYRALTATIGMNIPVLISVRINPIGYYDFLSDKIQMPLLLPRAAGCVFQTPGQRDFFPEYLRKKSRIILNPINDKFIGNEKPHEREKVVVHSGRLVDFKNQRLLINAFEQVHQKHPEYILKIYGPDSLDGTKQELEKQIDGLGAQGYIHLMGSSGTLEKDMINAAVAAYSSDYEGMPNVILEAMALGLPVVSTDCPPGGPRMVIAHEENGLLVPVGDKDALAKAINRLIEDRDLAERLGDSASQIGKKASAEIIFEEWRDYINDILGGSRQCAEYADLCLKIK